MFFVELLHTPTFFPKGGFFYLEELNGNWGVNCNTSRAALTDPVPSTDLVSTKSCLTQEGTGVPSYRLNNDRRKVVA